MKPQEIEMQRVNEYRFYELGQKIRGLHTIRQETQYASVVWVLWEAREALTALKDDAVAFRISMQTTQRLIDAITAIVPIDVMEAAKKAPQDDATPKPLGYSAYELSEALRAFEPVLAAECNALDTYVISQKRGYSTPDLVERAERMLSTETVVLMEASVIEDIRSAGRCLAFDVPTAAGFHILRAVEAVMAEYYTHITGRQLKKQHRNWALYLKKLEKEPASDGKIRGALEHIKENYRNPITHPEITLTESAAIMLFGLCLSVVELMAEAMRSLPPALTDIQELKALTEIAEQNAAAPPEDF